MKRDPEFITVKLTRGIILGSDSEYPKTTDPKTGAVKETKFGEAGQKLTLPAHRAKEFIRNEVAVAA